MEILKHGDPAIIALGNPSMTFTCNNCGCMFTATLADFKKLGTIPCPDCTVVNFMAEGVDNTDYKVLYSAECEHAEKMDKRRRDWVRRYKEEHERAVSLDKKYNCVNEELERFKKENKRNSDNYFNVCTAADAFKSSTRKYQGLVRAVKQLFDIPENVKDDEFLNEMKRFAERVKAVKAYRNGSDI